MNIVTTNTITNKMRDELYTIHQEVFGDINHFHQKLIRKTNLIFTLAIIDNEIHGYKIGYPLNEDCFYSWMGAVKPASRNLGITSRLMETQHEWAKNQNYKSIETKTMNRWRQMLLLNIRHGFDVKAVNIDKNGREKILLRKQLNV